MGKEGSLPQSWREATMIPIHKPGKAKTEATSYRPISLTSCMVKLLERIINTQTEMVFLKQKNYLYHNKLDSENINAQKIKPHIWHRK